MKRSEFFRRLDEAVEETARRASNHAVSGLAAIEEAKTHQIFVRDPNEEHDSRNPVVKAIVNGAWKKVRDRGLTYGDIAAGEEAYEYFDEQQKRGGGIVEIP